MLMRFMVLQASRVLFRLLIMHRWLLGVGLSAKSIYRARYPVPCHRRSMLSRAACALCIPFLFLGPLNLFPAHIKTAHSSSIVSSPPTPFPVVGFLHRLALMLFADSFLASSKVSFSSYLSCFFFSQFFSVSCLFIFFFSLSAPSCRGEWLDRIIQNIVRSMHEESSISYFIILSLLFVLPSHLCLCSNVCRLILVSLFCPMSLMNSTHFHGISLDCLPWMLILQDWLISMSVFISLALQFSCAKLATVRQFLKLYSFN